MYRIIKRDGRIVDFDITKIAAAIKKAFEATETPEGEGIVDYLALRVTADFAGKVQNGLISIEQIQDSVETVLSRAGYEEVAKAYILYRKQHERIRKSTDTLLDYKNVVDTLLEDSFFPIPEPLRLIIGCRRYMTRKSP